MTALPPRHEPGQSENSPLSVLAVVKPKFEQNEQWYHYPGNPHAYPFGAAASIAVSAS